MILEKVLAVASLMAVSSSGAIIYKFAETESSSQEKIKTPINKEEFCKSKGRPFLHGIWMCQR